MGDDFLPSDFTIPHGEQNFTWKDRKKKEETAQSFWDHPRKDQLCVVVHAPVSKQSSSQKYTGPVMGSPSTPVSALAFYSWVFLRHRSLSLSVSF